MLTGEEVMEIRIMHRQGKSIRSIAKGLSISRWTVCKYLGSPGLEPDYGPRAARASKLDPFRAYSDGLRCGVFGVVMMGTARVRGSIDWRLV